MVSEAIFPTNRGYICIEKWSQIFVSGIGSALTESEEKSLFQLPISKKIHRETFFFSVHAPATSGEITEILSSLVPRSNDTSKWLLPSDHHVHKFKHEDDLQK